jgi:alpha-ketoglutarate-dependent 2,4-dichlorophenoxyacetate dioxygenase
MSILIQPIDPGRPDFGGKAQGIDLRQMISQEDTTAIIAGMDRFGIMVFPGQVLDNRALLDFAEKLGPLEQAKSNVYQGDAPYLDRQITEISNLDQDRRCLDLDDPKRFLMLTSRLWHTDSSFKTIPAKYSLLSAWVLPPTGGETEFADMRAAYDALSDEMKETAEPLVCEHSLMFCRAFLGLPESELRDREDHGYLSVMQRLVRRLPGSGRKALYFGHHAGAIDGWHLPDARLFLNDLMMHATQREFVYRHVWQPYDLMMWDNRAVMHRGRPYDERRIREMHRAAVAGDASTLVEPC